MVRSHVYPKMVDQGKLTKEEAERRTAALVFAQSVLEVEAAKQAQAHDRPGPKTYHLNHFLD